MKKLIVLISMFLLLIGLTACGNSTSPKVNNTKTSVGTNDTKKINITYTKEFSYLPAYSNMELQSITTPTDKNKLITAKYIIKNTTTDKVLNEYSDIFKKDGWEVDMSLYKDKKPFSATAKKANHVAILTPEQNGSDIVLTITSM